MDPFFIADAKTITATTTSAATVMPGSIQQGQAHARIVRQSNGGRVFIKFGTSSVSVTSATGTELIPGVVELLSVPANSAYIAAITDTGTVDINISVGRGT